MNGAELFLAQNKTLFGDWEEQKKQNTQAEQNTKPAESFQEANAAISSGTSNAVGYANNPNAPVDRSKLQKRNTAAASTVSVKTSGSGGAEKTNGEQPYPGPYSRAYMRLRELTGLPRPWMGANASVTAARKQLKIKYGIDADHFMYKDFENWAKKHNFVLNRQGDEENWAASRQGDFLNISDLGGHNVTTKEAERDLPKLEALARNNEKKKKSGKGEALLLSYIDAASLGFIPWMGDWTETTLSDALDKLQQQIANDFQQMTRTAVAAGASGKGQMAAARELGNQVQKYCQAMEDGLQGKASTIYIDGRVYHIQAEPDSWVGQEKYVQQILKNLKTVKQSAGKMLDSIEKGTVHADASKTMGVTQASGEMKTLGGTSDKAASFAYRMQKTAGQKAKSMIEVWENPPFVRTLPAGND